MSSYARAFADFLAADEARPGWPSLPEFHKPEMTALLRRIDARAAEGVTILPVPADLMNALRLTPPADLRAVILGQDPYPTPGDAHGLAFSYAGQGRLPASLRNIFREMADDCGGLPPGRGNLTYLARQGVLLLNTALTVEAGHAGAHLGWGWQRLTEAVIRAAGAKPQPCVFMLWGDKARACKPHIGAQHLVIEGPHPSPLSAYRGFFGSRPFSRANAFLAAHGRGRIDWLPFPKPGPSPT